MTIYMDWISWLVSHGAVGRRGGGSEGIIFENSAYIVPGHRKWSLSKRLSTLCHKCTSPHYIGVQMIKLTKHADAIKTYEFREMCRSVPFYFLLQLPLWYLVKFNARQYQKRGFFSSWNKNVRVTKWQVSSNSWHNNKAWCNNTEKIS